MKNKQGFTLVEVILSLAILGIIAIAFLGATASHFYYLKSSVAITHNDFKAQELMEIEIDEAKLRVLDPTTSLESVTLFQDDLGGIDVYYEEVDIIHNNKEYYSLVSNVRPDPLDLIYLDTLSIELHQNLVRMKGDYYGYTDSSFSINGQFNNHNNFKFDHLLNQIEWFSTTGKFNIPLPKDSGADYDDPDRQYYPIFPRDYEVFKNETVYRFGHSENKLSVSEDLKGKHIIYTVTPAAKSGKLGTKLVSKPIYISGLPDRTDIVSHMDASYIDMYSGNDEAEKIGDSYLVNKWYDLSSILGRSEPNVYAQSPTSQSRPIIMKTDIDEQYIGQYVKFEGHRYLDISKGSQGTTLSIYVVARNRSAELSDVIKSGSQSMVLEGTLEGESPVWTIMKEIIVLDSSIITMGGAEVDIAEVLIYSNENHNESKILEYLSRKYFTVASVTE